jgi:hypothetical protein
MIRNLELNKLHTMSKIKDFFQFLNDNRGVTNVISIVLVVVLFLYLIIFRINPSFETVTIINTLLTPLITVIGFVLVIVSLKGIKLSNKAILSEPVYNKLTEEIKLLINEADNRIISDEQMRVFQYIVHTNCSGIKYSNFVSGLYMLLRNIREEKLYQHLLELIEKKEFKLSPEDLLSSESYLTRIQEVKILIRIIIDFYWKVFIKYQKIYNNQFLLKQQKEQLFQSLDEVCFDYLKLSLALFDIENSNLYGFDDDKSVLSLPLISFTPPDVISVQENFLNERFLGPYNHIVGLKKQLLKKHFIY